MSSKRSHSKNSHKKPTAEAYGEWMRGTSLVDLHASWFHCEVDGYQRVLSKWAELELDFDQKIGQLIDESNNSFSFRQRINCRAEAGEDSHVELGAEFEVTFTSMVPTEEAYLEVFIKNTLDLITRPYFREFLSSSLARMGLPGELLPLVKKGTGQTN